MRLYESTDLFDAPTRARSVRRFFVALLALAIVGGIVAVAIWARKVGEPPAELRIRSGGVGVRLGATEFRAAEEGENLRSGDSVRTDSAGQAQVDFFDGSLTRLDSDTDVGFRDLTKTRDGRRISLRLRAGRTWNRVAEASSPDDRFEMRMPDATASVQGTTFLADCRTTPTCYVVGVTSATRVTSLTGEISTTDAGDCVRISEHGLDTCNEKKLGLIDAWVKENLAEDQQLTLKRAAGPTVSPSPTPSASPAQRTKAPRVRRNRTPQPATPTPTIAPTPTPTPLPTPAPPTPTPTPTCKPKRCPTPTPAPTPTPSPAPDDFTPPPS
jgi:ferric-dicitrate binding protein FerR (iron transport regulator)